MMINLKRIFCIILVGIFIGIGVFYYIGDKYNQGERNALSLMKDKLTNTQKEPVNLIICWTPLQMLIAEKIIERNPNEKFYFVLMSYVKNDVFEHYFNRLKNKTERAYSFYIPYYEKEASSFYYVFTELKLKGLLLPEIKTVYLANLGSFEIHTLLNSYTNTTIKTFDDGTANLVLNGYLSKDNKHNFGKIKNIFYNFITPNYTTKFIRDHSVEHYTIFDKFPNIMGGGRKITYLPLFDVSELKASNQIKDTVKIMLGTVEEKLKETSEKIIDHFKIKYVTLHPRQTYELDNAITLKSKLTIEDYLLQEIKKNPHTQYEIYTFFSGAALTLQNFPNVKVYAIKPTSFPDDYWLSPIYYLFEQAQIPIIPFDDKK